MTFRFPAPRRGRPKQAQPAMRNPGPAAAPEADAGAVPVIKYDEYTPRDEPRVYTALDAAPGGSIVDRAPLDPALARFLSGTLRADMALWDGTEGFGGVWFCAAETMSHRPTVKPAPVTASELAELCDSLRKLAEIGADVDRRRRLRKDLGRHAKISGELETALGELNRRVNVLDRLAGLPVVEGVNGEPAGIWRGDSMTPMDERKLAGHGSDEGMSDTITAEDLRRVEADLREAREELKPLTAALHRSSAKTNTIREELEEFDSATARRSAVLERVFGHDPSGASALALSARAAGDSMSSDGDSQGPLSPTARDRGNRVAQLAKNRNRAFVRHWRVFRVLVDAKKGVTHLFALESALKDILQNLSDAMATASAGLRTDASSAENMPVSSSFRLRYVRQLQKSADAILVDAVHYAPFSGMAEAVTDCNKDGRPTLLSEFGKLSILSTLSTKERINSHYDCARVAYKKVNTAYDKQLALVKSIVEEFEQTGHHLEEIESALNKNRCRLLLSRSVNEKLLGAKSRG